MQGKKAVVDRFMSIYDQIIQSTIRKHNNDIYLQLKQFLQSDKNSEFSETSKNIMHGVNGLQIRGLGGSVGEQHIPTCLVITSNESSSSIETQFNALQQELKLQLNAINIVIDEKKCGNMKQTIEHIQNNLKNELEIPLGEELKYQQNNNQPESGDEVNLCIYNEDS